MGLERVRVGWAFSSSGLDWPVGFSAALPLTPSNGARPWTHWIFWVPFPRDWRPGEPEATERRAAMGAAPLGAVLTIFFIAPAWILSRLSAGRNGHIVGAL